MRISLVSMLATAVVGCGGGTAPTSGDDAVPTDAPTDGSNDGPLVAPAHGFQIVSPTVTLDPYEEITYCYYFRTSNTSDVSIQKWTSRMTAGGHDAVMYLTRVDLKKAGTLGAEPCGITSDGIGPLWAYAMQNVDGKVSETSLPADDGQGHPVGQPILANQSGFLQMHYLNPTGEKLQAHVEINGYAYDDSVQATPAGTFVTYNTTIDLSPGSAVAPTSGMVHGDCTISPNIKFYAMTTHTHKQAVHTFVKDGTTSVLDNTSWDFPQPMEWKTAPFFSFTSGKLSYQCEYTNPNNRRIQTGDTAAMDETCMAVGYFFPSPGGAGSFCLNSLMLN